MVSDLLARAPGLKVLATSRTPLHAYGEQEFRSPRWRSPIRPTCRPSRR